jgi:hypothetical protein
MSTVASHTPLARNARRVVVALAPWRWLLVPLTLVLASRATVFAIGYVGLHLVPASPRLNTMFHSLAYTARPDLGPWFAWDASWYAEIALHGYQAHGPGAATVAFWPLLPLLEAALSRLLQLAVPRISPGGAVLWAGLIVVFAAFSLAMVLFYRLVDAQEGPDVARRAVAFLAFAPGALYFTAPYPEALLIGAVAGCLWALRCERWALAGLAGGLGAVAHVPGCLLAIPFAWEYVTRRRGRLDWSALWVFLIPLGPAIWLAYLWTLTGHPLAPVRAAQTLWPHRWHWPWETLATGAHAALSNHRWEMLEVLNLWAVMLALVSLLWTLRVGPVSWGLWGLAVLILHLSLPAYKPFDGMLRYTLAILPTWLLLARLARHPAAEGAIIGALAALLGLLTALYIRGHWVA